MIENQLMERIQDFEHNGETIPASRLGYRITSRFIRHYAGRVFDNPNKVFDEAILKPETQNLDAFADGVKYITEAHERVAKAYFEDGSIDQACPPLKALLHIMVHGEFEGHRLNAPEVRSMFTLESMLASDWYKARLEAQQRRDVALWSRHVKTLSDFMERPESKREAEQLDIAARLATAKFELNRVSSAEYLVDLSGQSGADPMGEWSFGRLTQERISSTTHRPTVTDEAWLNLIEVKVIVVFIIIIIVVEVVFFFIVEVVFIFFIVVEIVVVFIIVVEVVILVFFVIIEVVDAVIVVIVDRCNWGNAQTCAAITSSVAGPDFFA
jgi:hypothetical protein